MTKRRALYALGAYFLIFFGAILARVDYYPFTWVPMYGARDEGDMLHVTVGDLDARERGFRAVRADGTSGFIDMDDLNMPPANFRRLYSERMFGEGPPQDRRERLALIAFNQWWYDRLIGKVELVDGIYQRKVLDSVNRTLGLGPADPRRVVQIEAEVGQINVTREQRDSGEIHVHDQQRLRAVTTPAGTVITALPQTEVPQ